MAEQTDQQKERWMSIVALGTAIFAVFAALTTLYMGKYSSRTILNQAQETNEWSYYQSKSIKSYVYDIQRQKLELELLEKKGRLPKELSGDYAKLIDKYKGQVRRYEQEMKEIKSKADNLAASKTDASARAGNYGYALIFVQVAIMLCSVAALTKRKYLFYLGLCTMGGWTFFFLDAIFLFY